MESSRFFGRQFSMWHKTKRCSSIFDLGPLTPKIESPKFGTKSPISRLVWQIDRRCLGLLGFFSGMADSMEPVLGKILFESILSISTSTGTQKVIKILFKYFLEKNI